MHYLSLEDFLKKYKRSPADRMSYDEFILSASVIVGKYEYSLKDYIKSKNIDKSTVMLLLDYIKNRESYLTRFYNMSLRVTDKNEYIHGNMKPMTKRLDNNTGVIFKNLIRNIHFEHILKHTSSGLDNIPTYLHVIDNLFKKNIIDYKILTPSSIHYMKNGRLGSVFSSYYFRASILNPYLIYSLNISILKGTKVFTPTLGWSSYAFGFLECPLIKEYVGTDVIPDVCNKTKVLASRYNKKIDIYCKPSEELSKNKTFMKKYREHFDIVFFSPPYYKLEMYDSKNQSTIMYKTYDEWLEKYWRATVELCKDVLNNGGYMCYILSGYGSENGKNYNLIEDMNTITNEYFQYVSIQPMFNKNVHATKHRDTGEKIILYKKP